MLDQEQDVVSLPVAGSAGLPWPVRAWRALPLPLVIPLGVSLAVLGAGVVALSPLRDAATLRELPDVSLVRPAGYLALAPVSDILDTLTLLSARQHVAVLIGLLAAWLLWRLARRASWRAHARSLALLLAAIGATYAAALLLPRPMAYLAAADPDVLRIDFHSHTRSSKDARRSFSLERNRAWHRAGGYDVAYITDHGAIDDDDVARVPGSPDKPRPQAVGGVVLLPGIEVSWRGEHVGVLGTDRSCRRLLSTNLHDFDPRGMGSAAEATIAEPILVWNHPRDGTLQALPPEPVGDAAGLDAIEVSNGAPHGMDWVRPKRQQIISLARRHGLALLAGSDNHGWGYVAPNWTLMELPGWRELDVEALAAGIARSLRENRMSSTTVVERTTADPGNSGIALAASVLAVPWRMLTTLSIEERLVWLAWTWMITAAVLTWRRRRGRPQAPTPALD